LSPLHPSGRIARVVVADSFLANRAVVVGKGRRCDPRRKAAASVCAHSDCFDDVSVTPIRDVPVGSVDVSAGHSFASAVVLSGHDIHTRRSAVRGQHVRSTLRRVDDIIHRCCQHGDENNADEGEARALGRGEGHRALVVVVVVMVLLLLKKREVVNVISSWLLYLCSLLIEHVLRLKPVRKRRSIFFLPFRET